MGDMGGGGERTLTANHFWLRNICHKQTLKRALCLQYGFIKLEIPISRPEDYNFPYFRPQSWPILKISKAGSG